MCLHYKRRSVSCHLNQKQRNVRNASKYLIKAVYHVESVQTVMCSRSADHVTHKRVRIAMKCFVVHSVTRHIVTIVWGSSNVVYVNKYFVMNVSVPWNATSVVHQKKTPDVLNVRSLFKKPSK